MKSESIVGNRAQPEQGAKQLYSGNISYYLRDSYERVYRE
jgi:hypothetical protein